MTHPTNFVRLDQVILSPLAGKKQLFTYETTDLWEQIKTPGMSLKDLSGVVQVLELERVGHFCISPLE